MKKTKKVVIKRETLRVQGNLADVAGGIQESLKWTIMLLCDSGASREARCTAE